MPIDELNVSGMMKNRHLSKAVASQKFYEFRTKPKVKCDDIKCDDNGIESGTADDFILLIRYPTAVVLSKKI